MTAPTGTSATTTRPWTPRIATQLSVLACAAFIYVTAEILPVGALSAIARNLRVSVVLVGTLLSWYALVAAVTTVPLVRWTAHWPRRRALVVSLVCLTVSQLVSALAPNFAVLAAGGCSARSPMACCGRSSRRSPPGWCRPVTPGAPRRRSTSEPVWRWSSVAHSRLP